MGKKRRSLTIMLAVLAVFVTATPAFAGSSEYQPRHRTGTYEVTITNITDGQWLTPPAAATHARRFDAFTKGRPASAEVAQIAENGNLAPFVAELDASTAVRDHAVAPYSEDLPPIGPGKSVTFTLGGKHRDRFSFVSMLICTNDGFTGSDSVRLPRKVGETKVTYGRALDAGTEVNTEAWADLVPPCAQLTGFGDQGGTGMSNPDLAENGRIRHHRGIEGVADLVPDVHDFGRKVAKIEITRID